MQKLGGIEITDAAIFSLKLVKLIWSNLACKCPADPYNMQASSYTRYSVRL